MSRHYEVTFTAPEQAELLPMEVSETAEAGKIAGPTVASLISAGTELGYGYQGKNFPVTPGYASVFRVEHLGEGAEGFEIGDLALATGPHRSYQSHLARESWRVPAGLSGKEAAFARLMGVSMSTLVTTTARPPDRVVVTGLGPVGHLAAQQFQACGYTVLAYDPDETRRELATKGGIADVRGELPLEDAEWLQKVSLVVECSGHEAAVLDGCRLVRRRGEVVLIGVPWRKRTDLSAHELLHAVFHRYAVVRSGWEWEVPLEETAFQTGSIKANIEAALRWLDGGKIRIAGLYSTYEPKDCQKAYQALLKAKEKSLGVVFDWASAGEEKPQ